MISKLDRDLLQLHAFGLDERKIRDDEEHEVPGRVDEVEPPAQIFHRVREGEGGEEPAAVVEHFAESDAGRAQLEGTDFCRVEGCHWGDAEMGC